MKYFKKAIISLILILFSIAPLFSAGFHVNLEQGMKAMGMAGAFVGLADDPTALYYNPAGITQLKGKLNIAGTYTFGLLAPTIHNPRIYDRYGILRLSQSTKKMDRRWAQIPSFYLTYKLTDHWYTGFAFFAPFGTVTDWTHTWIGRYFADKTKLLTYDFNPTVAYKFNDKFTFAAGLDYVYSRVEIKKSFSYPFVAFNPVVQKTLGFTLTPAQQLSLYNRLYDRNYDVDLKLHGDTGSSGKGWGFNIGMMYKPNDEWQFGLTYRSEIDLHFDGHADVNYMPGVKTLGAEVGIPQLSAFPLFKRTKISAYLHLPAYIAFGVANKSFKNWTLLMDIYWTEWSKYRKLEVKYEGFPYRSSVPKKWNDVIAVRLGAQYQVDDKLALRFGYMYDQSPIIDSTRGPELPTSDRNDFGFGMSYKIGHFNIDLAYLFVFFKTKHSELVDETTGTKLTGRYHTCAHVVGTTISYQF